MGLGPVYAIQRAEQKTGLRLKDAELIEINEAFAAQVLACQIGRAQPSTAASTSAVRVPSAKSPMKFSM